MEIHFEITNRCPFRCRHCSSWELRAIDEIGYSFDDACNLINSLDKPINVFLTGGEPLLDIMLNKKISQLHLLENVENIGLFTTGQITQDGKSCAISLNICESLKESGLSVCYVSLYDFESKEHDGITQIKGSFNETIASIKLLVSRNITVKLNVVVHRNNIDRLEQITKLAEKLDVGEVRFLKLIEHGNAAKNWDIIGLNENTFLKKVRDVNSKKCKITVSGFPKFFNCRPYDNALHCQAGIELLYVDYLGNVYPCASVKNINKYCLGNIKQIGQIHERLIDTYNTTRLSCLADLL